MTEHEFLALITSKSARDVLDDLSQMPAKDRRSFARPAMKLYKEIDRAWLQSGNAPERKVKDGEAVTVAVLATASASELKKLSFFPRPGNVSLEDIVRALRPDWLQPVVDHFVEQRTFYVDWFRPLWEAGLCVRPESDAVILGYYRYMQTLGDGDDTALLSGDVWRFFEVEGGGEDSLANHDKYLKSGQESWAERLRRYSDDGKLDRQRLLDASLDALERDFAQYRAGWYSRFHVLMAPDADEMTARAGRYLGLLASSVPPTVSFALKHVQALDKADALDPAQLIAALEPAVQARAKGTVLTALKLLQSAAGRQPSLRSEAASLAVLALISEDAAVQGKALDVIEALGVEAVTDDLAGYVDLAAPSVRPRIAALAGVAAAGNHVPEIAVASGEARPLLPVETADEALALFLTVLEEPRDPFEVERAIDGISRFGVALQADTTALSPLRKRAKQVCASPGHSDIRHVLALTGRALAECVSLKTVLREMAGGRTDGALVPEMSLQEFHLARNGAVVARVAAGHALPLLCLPGDTSGLVSVDHLVARMAAYRRAGVAPDLRDLALAMMRLSQTRRSTQDLPLETEADRALAYALGGHVPVGPTPELWAVAWCARNDEMPDDEVAGLFAAPTPDCGRPAERRLVVSAETSQDGAFTWIDVDVPVTPENTAKSRALPALFGARVRNHFDAACSGHTFADIAWASLVRPADPEPFFRAGLLHQDTWQKLSDNHTRAYLEPFFRPGPPTGSLGAGVLAYYMACEDKSVSSLAAEAAARLSGEGRLTAKGFSHALKQFLLSQSLPTARWTKALKTMAELGAGTFVRESIVHVLDFASEDTPRDIGGLLELCYELHIASGATLEKESAIACLQCLPGGGKAAKFRKNLLALTP